MKTYIPADVEAKWQKHWEENKTYNVENHAEGKENEYILIEFPYPSGSGLHLGHCRSYTAIDAVARTFKDAGVGCVYSLTVAVGNGL